MKINQILIMIVVTLCTAFVATVLVASVHAKALAKEALTQFRSDNIIPRITLGSLTHTVARRIVLRIEGTNFPGRNKFLLLVSRLLVDPPAVMA